jgi:MarR family transcriptional regulator, organic hydroperoxide resistance regulator
MASRQGSVIAALEATVHVVLDHLAEELADLGLSQGEVNALLQLDEGVALTVARLQASTGQRASTLTGVLDRLERRGLVERALNPEDRRSFTVVLTKAGVAVGRRIRQTFGDLDAMAQQGISRRSLDGYFEVLRHLAELTAQPRGTGTRG